MIYQSLLKKGNKTVITYRETISKQTKFNKGFLVQIIIMGINKTIKTREIKNINKNRVLLLIMIQEICNQEVRLCKTKTNLHLTRDNNSIKIMVIIMETTNLSHQKISNNFMPVRSAQVLTIHHQRNEISDQFRKDQKLKRKL